MLKHPRTHSHGIISHNHGSQYSICSRKNSLKLTVRTCQEAIPKRVFQPSILRCELLVSRRVPTSWKNLILRMIPEKNVRWMLLTFFP